MVKRIKTEAQAVATKVERGPMPDFVKEIIRVRKDYLGFMNTALLQGMSLQAAKMAVRANQILNAYIKGRPLTSVESGPLYNHDFADALQGAILFMTLMAENKHNIAFRAWVEHELKENGVGHMISRPNDVQVLIPYGSTQDGL